jgi:hypothetical protein
MPGPRLHGDSAPYSEQIFFVIPGGEHSLTQGDYPTLTNGQNTWVFCLGEVRDGGIWQVRTWFKPLLGAFERVSSEPVAVPTAVVLMCACQRAGSGTLRRGST